MADGLTVPPATDAQLEALRTIVARDGLDESCLLSNDWIAALLARVEEERGARAADALYMDVGRRVMAQILAFPDKAFEECSDVELLAARIVSTARRAEQAETALKAAEAERDELHNQPDVRHRLARARELIIARQREARLREALCACIKALEFNPSPWWKSTLEKARAALEEGPQP